MGATKECEVEGMVVPRQADDHWRSEAADGKGQWQARGVVSVWVPRDWREDDSMVGGSEPRWIGACSGD